MTTEYRTTIDKHSTGSLAGADVRQLEREIDQTRLRLESSVGEIERRLAPDRLLTELLSPIRSNGREFADTLVSRISANPIPVLLAATSIGWLMRSDSRPPVEARRNHPDNDSFAADGQGDTFQTQRSLTAKLSDMTHGAAGKVRVAKDRASAAGRGMADAYGDVKDRVGTARDAAGEGVAVAQEKLVRAAESGRSVVERTAHGTAQLYRERPMTFAMVGLAVGAIAGALLPSTRQEDEAFGETSDQVRAQAGQLVGDSYESAKDLASTKAGEIAQEFKDSPAARPAGS